ncbi:mannosyltransferase [Aureisphaera sp. CAU 1614]|uniref:Mannosyltransferase n=1 Tax=Halomarinibacterium sedimenti TaxID=2857106 RepID=A0A9X1FM25_9FLAO|nr:mannosyltransferase [Halomarinibacterium sedimenti]MBW2936892.1 mannosyltransferase [Halomarinibacterium sedimenti]
MASMYGSFAYDLVRSDFTKLISLFGGLFILTYQLTKMYGWNFKLLLGLGIFFRIIFLFATPNLSQDFYRFIWDGQVLMQGYSPYLVSPETYLQNPSLAGFVIPQAEVLYQGMGMPSIANFTNYPPMNQLCFALATYFGGKSIIGSVIGLRIIIILADMGILYFGKKILEKLNLPIQNIFWYFLNPFIIIELTGNLHFEGVMLFFFVVSIFFLQKKKWLLSAVFLGLSVSTKLIPLIFLPIFFQWFWKKEYSFPEGIANLTKYYLVALGTVIITFLPFISSEFMTNYLATNALWFQNFEFNASIYYIIREIGFQIVGWNIIETVGKILPLIVIAFIIGITFFRKNTSLIQLVSAMLFSISFYFLLSTTIHPWYVATPLLLCIFTKYRFPVVWSATVMLSYIAYNGIMVEENFWLITLEYGIVAGYAIWEIFFKKEPKSFSSQKPILGS